MQKVFSLIFILSFALLNNSCKKSQDLNGPVITMAEPSPGDEFSMGADECHIEFSVTSDAELDDLSVTVTNASGVNYYTNEMKVDRKSYDFHDHFFANGITALTPFTLKIMVTDKNLKKDTKTVNFFLKP